MDDNFDSEDGGLNKTVQKLALSNRDLETSANGFARAMTGAFATSVSGGRQFDDILKSLTLKLSDMSLKLALAPVTRGVASGISGLFSGLFQSGSGSQADLKLATGGIKPFADGGVIGAPTYFPMSPGGVGLAGEAGPEAIVPLSRGPDGRLGIASQGGGGGVTINIATPDADSFRRSQAFVTGQIARAVARGQRDL